MYVIKQIDMECNIDIYFFVYNLCYLTQLVAVGVHISSDMLTYKFDYTW